jgi:ABC-type lipoprotein release transport system permease subunit
MFQPLSVFIGLRYVRARQHRFFVSFITWWRWRAWRSGWRR